MINMTIHTKTEKDTMTVCLKGRLDTTTAPDLEAALGDLEGKGIRRLRLDLKELAYISSAGLRVLLSTSRVMEKQGKMLVLNAGEEVMDVFEMTGFDRILTIRNEKKAEP